MKFTNRKAPVVYGKDSVSKRNLNIHIALFIVLIVSVIFQALVDNGDLLMAIVLPVVAMITSLITEILYALTEKRISKFSSYSAFVNPINTGLIIALLMPVQTPIYVIVLATLVGVYIGKLVFGGEGFYIFNPALVGVLFASASFKEQLTFPEGVTTPIEMLKTIVIGANANVNLNSTELLIGNYYGWALGATSSLLLLLILIYFIIRKIVDYRIVATYLLTVTFLTAAVAMFSDFGVFSYVFTSLSSGLIMFAAVFLVSDFTSSPTSRETKIIYAFIVGLLTVAIRAIGTEIEGVFYAILFGSMITPYLNRTARRSNSKAIIKTLIFVIIFAILMSYTLGMMVRGNISDATAYITPLMGVLL